MASTWKLLYFWDEQQTNRKCEFLFFINKLFQKFQTVSNPPPPPLPTHTKKTLRIGSNDLKILLVQRFLTNMVQRRDRVTRQKKKQPNL